MNKKNTEHDEKPNILLICSDQHSRRVCGCYGDAIVDTPAMDRLAREGILFKSAYCNAPLCVPSRMSFLTGLYPFKNETLNNGMCLDSRIPTFAAMALTEGYHTVLSGRMHFNGQDQYHGFTERLVGDVGGYDLGTGLLPFTPLEGSLGNGTLRDPFNVVGAGETFCLDYDREVSAATCDWLNRYVDDRGKKPFLMTVGFFNPHCPFIVSPELYEKYEDRVSLREISEDELVGQHDIHKKFRKKSSDGISDALKLKAKAAYYGQVDFLDQQINKILETLDSTGLAGNTIVVYFSDHGEMLGEHNRWHKMCFFEDSIGVPLIIRMPDQTGAGEEIHEHVSLVDIFPTICDWMDVEVDHPVSGGSLVPFIEGKKRFRANLVKAEYYESGLAPSLRMVLKDAWKLNYSNEHGAFELFNLDEDPNEHYNRINDHRCKEIVNDLMTRVFDDGWHDDFHKNLEEKLIRFGYWNIRSRIVMANSVKPIISETSVTWKGYNKNQNWVIEQDEA